MNKLLTLSLSVLSSQLLFADTAIDNNDVIHFSDPIMEKDWYMAPKPIQSIKLEKKEINDFLHAEAQRFPQLSKRLTKNNWFSYNPIKKIFDLTLPQTLQPSADNKNIAIVVHGCDSCKEDMADLASIIYKTDPILYGQFLFFEYDSHQGIEVIAYKLSKDLHHIIKTNPEAKISIFTHSMGGLVSRKALQMSVDNQSGNHIPLMKKIVDRQTNLALVTFGTPHGGVPSFFGIRENKKDYFTHKVFNTSNTFLNGFKYIGNGVINFGGSLFHRAVRDMMTNNPIAPTAQSRFLACLNNSNQWEFSKNLHLFTVAGNAAASYAAYGSFRILNYNFYSDHLYDGLVSVDSAFHPQLDLESDSWSKYMDQRIVIPANHYNMKGSKTRQACKKVPAALSCKENAYHVTDTNKKILNPDIILNYTQKELEILYKIFNLDPTVDKVGFVRGLLQDQAWSNYFSTARNYLWTSNLSEKIENGCANILTKYENLVNQGYGVKITTEEDMDQIVTQVMEGWLPKIRKLFFPPEKTENAQTEATQTENTQIEEAKIDDTQNEFLIPAKEPAPVKKQSGLLNKIKNFFK